MMSSYVILLVILSCSMVLSVITGKLTIAAAITGGMLGLLIFQGAGFTGIAMVATFFILGTAATSWKNESKVMAGLAEEDKGKRKAGQVLANAGMAGTLGLLAWLFPSKTVMFRLMIAASLSSALSDTLSSELGNVYGKRFYNMLTFKKDSRGLNGVVSIEGSLFGILGSVIIAIVYALGFGLGIDVFAIVLGGIVGNISDSILGATLERRGVLNNNQVNFLNTFIAAVASLILYLTLMR